MLMKRWGQDSNSGSMTSVALCLNTVQLCICNGFINAKYTFKTMHNLNTFPFHVGDMYDKDKK